MKKQISLSIMMMTITILLMAFTKGIPMTFAKSQTELITRYYSYFSLMPLGYGNLFPIVTVFLSICIAILLVISINKNHTKIIWVCLCITIVATLLSWIIFNTFSFISLTVLSLHIATFIIHVLPNHTTK